MRTDLFRHNLREICKERGAQRRLAVKAGLSPEWFNKMLRGHSEPTLATAEKIASAAGIPLETMISTVVHLPAENSAMPA